MSEENKHLLLEIEKLKKKLELSELKKLNAESDRKVLMTELMDTKKQLVNALKSFSNKDCGSSLNIFEESCRNITELDLLKFENQRILTELEKVQKDYFELQQKYDEYYQQAQIHEEEKTRFNERTVKIFQIMSDCTQKLKCVETDHAKLQKKHESINLILKNAMNGIEFLRNQLEKERKQNVLLIQAQANLNEKIDSLEESHQIAENKINQFKLEIQRLSRNNQ